MSIAFQPRVTVDTYELAGVECAVRCGTRYSEIWQEEFMAIADGAGIGDEISRWVIGERAVRWLRGASSSNGRFRLGEILRPPDRTASWP